MSKYPGQQKTITKDAQKPQQNRQAIAPYNFVELPEQVVPAEEEVHHDCYLPERHTGHITATLVNNSPLYIRTSLSPEAFAAIAGKRFCDLDDVQKRLYAQFFALHGKPTLPGSSLRGMLRSLVEIASHSKVTRVTDRQLVYRSVGDTTSLVLQRGLPMVS